MLRSSRPKAEQFPFGPLMRAKKRYRLRSQTAGKELNRTFCRKYLKCFSKGWEGPWEVSVWDWQFLKQSSKAMAARFMRRVKEAELAPRSRSSLKQRKRKPQYHLQLGPRSSTARRVLQGRRARCPEQAQRVNVSDIYCL